MNVGSLANLLDEILRHADGEGTPAHQHDHAAGIFREEHGGLASRVSAADDEDVFILTGSGFSHCCAIVNAGSLQAFEPRNLKFAIRDASGDDQRLRSYLLAVGKFDEF